MLADTYTGIAKRKQHSIYGRLPGLSKPSTGPHGVEYAADVAGPTGAAEVDTQVTMQILNVVDTIDTVGSGMTNSVRHVVKEASKANEAELVHDKEPLVDEGAEEADVNQLITDRAPHASGKGNSTSDGNSGQDKIWANLLKNNRTQKMAA